MKALSLRPSLALNLAFLAIFWLLVFNRLHTEWIVNSMYSYGWAVPFLALYLFSERWRDRPSPAEKPPHLIWLIVPAALVLLYLPIRIVNEANPDWVKINVYLTATVAALSFSALFAIGRLRYMWHFAFPILFVFTALPWPVQVEENIVQALTRWNTNVSAEALSLCGVPAITQGNLIQVGSSWVNVAEACSGIRSLQTAFMMSLFLGEFYRLGVIWRVLLMGSSFVVAFGLNIGRTMTLTYIAGASGTEEMEKWHDHVGNAVMVLCLAGLWFLALGFDKLNRRLRAQPDEASIAAAKKAAASRPAFPLIPLPFPVSFVVGALGMLAVAEIGTEAWYRHHENQFVPPQDWAVKWPTQAAKFKMSEFPERTRAILKYNEAESASWTTPEGYTFSMYYVRWYRGRVSKFLARAHYPTVCLPATGLEFKALTGRFPCPTGGDDVSFTTFLFESNKEPVYVFHAIIEDQPSPEGEKFDYRQVDSSERISSVLRGHRNLGQRVVGISLMGPKSQHDAEIAVYEALSHIVQKIPAKAAALP